MKDLGRARRAKQLHHFRHGVLDFHRCQRAATKFEFNFAFGQGFLANAESNRKANEVGVFEFHARPVVAIIQNDLNSRG